MGIKCSKCQKCFVSRPGELCYSCRETTKTVPPIQDDLDWLSRSDSHELSRTSRSDSMDDRLVTHTPIKREEKLGRVTDKSHVSGGRQITGVVTNYRLQDSAPVLPVRWFYSLVFGVPFCTRQSMQSFQIMMGELDEEYGGAVCCEVVIYGGAHTGGIADGNVVSVSGHRNRRGTIVARKVVNQSSRAVLTVRPAVPAWMVWLITAVLACVCVWISQMARNGASWAQQQGQRVSGLVNESGSTLILMVVIAVALVWYIMARIRDSRRRRRSKMSWLAIGILLLVLCLLFPQVGLLLLVLGGIVYALKILLTGR